LRPKLTTEELDAKVEKLPRWARNVIAQARMRGDSLEKELDTLRSKTPTDAYWESYGHSRPNSMPERMYLPGGRATFCLGTDKYGREHTIDVVVETTIEGAKAIGVRAYHSGLRVFPTASNCVTLTTLPDKD